MSDLETMNVDDDDILVYEEHATLRDVLVLIQDGEVVARAHATYDLSEFPEEFRDKLGDLARMRVVLMPKATIMEYEIRQDNWLPRIEAWESLPWWQRIFTRKPSFWDEENFPSANDRMRP